MMEAHECQLEIKINELENYKTKLDQQVNFQVQK